MASKRLPTVEEALQYAVRAIQGADHKTGKAALQWVLQREPDNVVALLWMSRVAPSSQAQQLCLECVSAINPYRQ